MNTEARQQDALANVIIAAERLHQLRALAAETEALLAAAMVSADQAGLTKTLVAEAAGLTRGRVSQIVAATQHGLESTTRARLSEISQFPGDALHALRKTFTGRMTFPPYARRRTAA